jgi:hypothetical protein
MNRREALALIAGMFLDMPAVAKAQEPRQKRSDPE